MEERQNARRVTFAFCCRVISPRQVVGRRSAVMRYDEYRRSRAAIESSLQPASPTVNKYESLTPACTLNTLLTMPVPLRRRSTNRKSEESGAESFREAGIPLRVFLETGRREDWYLRGGRRGSGRQFALIPGGFRELCHFVVINLYELARAGIGVAANFPTWSLTNSVGFGTTFGWLWKRVAWISL